MRAIRRGGEMILEKSVFWGGPAKQEKPLRAFLPPPYSLRPSHLARVILKNRPKIDDFGLHKPDFYVFMRATRRAAEEIIGQKVSRDALSSNAAAPFFVCCPLSGFSILSFCTGEIKKPAENGRFWFT